MPWPNTLSDPPRPPVMSDPPTPEEVEASHQYALRVRDDFIAQSNAIHGVTPPTFIPPPTEVLPALTIDNYQLSIVSEKEPK